jgi:glucuronosyltransferase
MIFWITCLYFLRVFEFSDGAKILFITPSFMRSNVILLKVHAKAMADRGHDVTLVSIFSENKILENYREFRIDVNSEDNSYIEKITNLGSNTSTLRHIYNAIYISCKIGNQTLQSDFMRELKMESFDLLVSGYIFSEFTLGLADHFDCPAIILYPNAPFSSVNRMIGNPLAPEGYSLFFPLTRQTGFFSRVFNFILTGLDLMIIKNYGYYKSKEVFE